MRDEHYCQWNITKLKENGSEAEEDPYAELNRILYVSSYITNAVGNVSRQITFYQHINGLCCLMGRLVSEFAKQPVTLISFVTMVCI